MTDATKDDFIGIVSYLHLKAAELVMSSCFTGLILFKFAVHSLDHLTNTHTLQYSSSPGYSQKNEKEI